MSVVALLGGVRATAFAALFALAALLAGWQSLELRHVRGAYDAHLRADDKAAAEQARIARATEDAWHHAVYDIVFDIETRRLQREAETTGTIAGLRSGAVRLQDRFTCPAVPATAAGAGAADDGAQRGLRVADAEFLVRFADECDTVVDERNAGRAYVEAVTGIRYLPAARSGLKPSTLNSAVSAPSL